jgi:hypothetical protein
MDTTNKSLSDYNEGESFRGETITRLYAAKSNYLIFEGDNCGDVTVATDDMELRKRCSGISAKVSIITEYLVTKKEKKKYVDQIGLAYAEAIEGNIEEANKLCDKLISRIELFKINKGRFYYLLSCLVVVFAAIIFSYFLKKYQFIPEIIPHFFIMTYASIGGFLSVAKDIKKVQIDSSDFGWFQIVYGATRIVIAMFSGLIVYVLLKSELILPALNTDDNIFIVFLLAIVAGFSESMIPNLLKKVENVEVEKENASA